MSAEAEAAASLAAKQAVVTAGAGSSFEKLYGRVSGPQAAAVLSQDAAVGRLKHARTSTGPDFDRLLAAFRASPMTGMMTILDGARKKSGYNPLSRGTVSAGVYFQYLTEIFNSRLFVIPPATDGGTFDLPPGQQPGDMVTRFVGNDPVLAPIIRGQISEVLGAAMKQQGVAQTQTLFTEMNLAADGRFRYIRSTCWVQIAVVMLPPMNPMMSARGGKHAEIFEFRKDEWPAQAERVLREHLCTVEDWLDEAGGIR